MMSTRVLHLAVFVMLASGAAAQGRPDFSGDWTLDRQASVLQGQSAAVDSGTMRIAHRDPSFTFSRTFIVNNRPQEASFEIRTDGAEVTRRDGPAPSRSRLEWQGSSLLLTALFTTPGGEVSNVVRYELLDGGKTLRAIEDLGGAAPPHHNVWIYQRR
jgi:hypothetical protein